MLADQQQNIITLLRSALDGKKYDFAHDVDFEYVYKIANRHQIVNLLFYGATNCGATSSTVFQDMFTKACTAIAQNEQQLFEIKKLIECFEQSNIDYMPLKGIILKYMYPKPDMRPMCDADILIRVDQYELIKKVLCKLGYSEEGESDHELSWSKQGLYLELHKRIVPARDEDYYSFFGDGWKSAIKSDENSNRYIMSDEDVMIYLFAHFTKHYTGAGIGIKHMVDLWVYRSKKPDMDEVYIEKKLKELHLFEFYKNIIHTLDAWFGDGNFNEKDEFITNVIFDNGLFGKAENAVISTASKSNKADSDIKIQKFKRLITMIFPPYSSMIYIYPVLKKLPVLLPILWIVRIFRTLFFRSKKISMQLHSIDSISDNNISSYKKSMSYVGLDINE